jgi:NADPH:quinone reductase-like Zn-dependent oxidoreductase
VIHVVRRAEQVDQLRALGAETVLNSSGADFGGALSRHCHELRATVAFDAVAGDLPGRLLGAMPRGSKVVVYGALSEQETRVPPQETHLPQGRVEGFWLSDYLAGLGVAGLLRRAVRVQRLLATDLQVKVRARAPLEDAVEAIERYQEHMSEGKVLLVP